MRRRGEETSLGRGSGATQGGARRQDEVLLPFFFLLWSWSWLCGVVWGVWWRHKRRNEGRGNDEDDGDACVCLLACLCVCLPCVCVQQHHTKRLYMLSTTLSCRGDA